MSAIQSQTSPLSDRLPDPQPSRHRMETTTQGSSLKPTINHCLKNLYHSNPTPPRSFHSPPEKHQTLQSTPVVLVLDDDGWLLVETRAIWARSAAPRPSPQQRERGFWAPGPGPGGPNPRAGRGPRGRLGRGPGPRPPPRRSAKGVTGPAPGAAGTEPPGRTESGHRPCDRQLYSFSKRISSSSRESCFVSGTNFL